MGRLQERHQGVLPFSTVAHIWRVIIATFTHAQAPYTVHIGGGDADLRDLARFHFGFSTPIQTHTSQREALQSLVDNKTDLALVPLESDSGWWLNLEHVHVIALLPELSVPEQPNFPSAAVFASSTVAVDMLDRCVVAIAASGASPIDTLLAQVGGAMLAGPVAADGRHHALGWVPRDALERFAETPELDVVTLGASASPVETRSA